MYLHYYAVGFVLCSFIDKSNKKEWILLSLLCVFLQCNMYIFDVSHNLRYITRTTLITLFALLLLEKQKILAIYQSFILLLFLVVNELMLYYLSNSNFFYKNFEAIIYGLVCCQFASILPRLWNIINNTYTNFILNFKNKSMDSRI